MSSHILSDELKEFINKNIDSIAQLEMVFLFFSNQEKVWNHEKINRELRSNVSATSKNMNILLERNMIEIVDDNYRYHPRPEEMAKKIAKLHAVYSERPVAVISFIYEKPKSAILQFADAFKLKKE